MTQTKYIGKTFCTDGLNNIYRQFTRHHPTGDVFQRTQFSFSKKKKKSSFKLLFLFVTISSRSFFTFVSRYLMSFSFFTTWHNVKSFELILKL